jgi:hypothetical protein
VVMAMPVPCLCCSALTCASSATSVVPQTLQPAHKRPPRRSHRPGIPAAAGTERGWEQCLRRDAATMPHMKAFGENPMDRTHA